MKKSLHTLAAIVAAASLLTSCITIIDNSNSASTSKKSKDNAVVTAIMQRRSIRKYKSTPVNRKEVKKLLTCGINAPSGMNKQPWALRVVDSKKFIKESTDAFVAASENGARMAADPDFKNMYRNAPTVLFVATPDGGNQLDAGLAVENILLAAQSMGIGSCCLGGPASFFNTPAAAPFVEQLNLPQGYKIILAVALGYPDEKPDAKPRDASKAKILNLK